ncbi:tetratricopeptide repeat protein [Sphingomonas sp. MMS24-J13]|uniref:tetratricopeptide repeat protein n=1 Tax=Sphingomonas sp. MMS24-J13 TaxID=3238686 RepID=UPI00384BC9DA
MDKIQSTRPIRIGRYALVTAALVAILAVALRYRHPAGESPAPEPAAMPGEHAVAPMIAALEAKLKANPGDLPGWRMLGQSYFAQGRFAEASKAMARATALAPQSADDWSALGEALVYAHRNGVDADAVHAFERAVAIDPKDARARYFLGVRKDLAGDHKGAIDDWIALLRDAPPGAAWAQSVRTLIDQVATREKIDVSGRVPAPVAAPAQDVATDAIPGPSPMQMTDAARLSPSEQDKMARAMVDRLAARLAQNPHDLDGWARLMRARLVLDDRAGAGQAYASARQAFAGDAGALAQLKDAAAALGL